VGSQPGFVRVFGQQVAAPGAGQTPVTHGIPGDGLRGASHMSGGLRQGASQGVARFDLCQTAATLVQDCRQSESWRGHRVIVEWPRLNYGQFVITQDDYVYP